MQPLNVQGLWHPLLLLSDGDAAVTRVQPNDLQLGGAAPGTLLLMGKLALKPAIPKFAPMPYA